MQTPKAYINRKKRRLRCEGKCLYFTWIIFERILIEIVTGGNKQTGQRESESETEEKKVKSNDRIAQALYTYSSGTIIYIQALY